MSETASPLDWPGFAEVEPALRGGEVDACGDHRLAMMAAIASCLRTIGALPKRGGGFLVSKKLHKATCRRES